MRAMQTGNTIRCGFDLRAAAAHAGALTARDFIRRDNDMLTVILNGSPHARGDTAQLIAALRSELPGQVEEVRAYSNDIAPCNDCRWCRTHIGCVRRDGMQRVYELLERADNVVVASPVYYSELTGRLLDLMSRLQTYYSRTRFMGAKSPLSRPRHGAILLVGGGDGEPDTALTTARRLLHCVGVSEPECAMSLRTDELPAAQDEPALAAARDIGRKLGEQCG